MSKDQFHWLVVRSSDELIKQSRELYKDGKVPLGGTTNKTYAYIAGPVKPPKKGVKASVHHVPDLSGNSMHFDISEVAFENAALAIAWAEKDGAEFLKNRKDAILVAFREPD